MACALLMAPPIAAAQEPAAPLELRRGDHVILLGNTLAERMQYFGHFETLLMTRVPERKLTVRNLGWSADTITLQPRPLNFPEAPVHLEQQRADVILAFFGLNESFGGEARLAAFEEDLDAYLKEHLGRSYNGESPPRLVLISPIAHERLARLDEVDVERRNRELARYTEVMRRTAARNGVRFVDLFSPTRRVMASRSQPMTINGIHLNAHGDLIVAELLMEGLGFAPRDMRAANGAELERLEALRAMILDKNEQFFYRWRPVNAEYVLGRRVDPFGSVNFPPEMDQLDRMVAERDHAIWAEARALEGLRYPDDRVPGDPGGEQSRD